MPEQLNDSYTCDECEQDIPFTEESMQSSFHADFCSLNPANEILVPTVTVGGITYDIGDFDR